MELLRLAIIAIDKDNLLIIVHPIRKIINWCYQRSTCKTEGTRSPPACEARNIGSVPSLIARRRSSHTLHDDKYIFRFLEIHLPAYRNTRSNVNNIRHTLQAQCKPILLDDTHVTHWGVENTLSNAEKYKYKVSIASKIWSKLFINKSLERSRVAVSPCSKLRWVHFLIAHLHQPQDCLI